MIKLKAVMKFSKSNWTICFIILTCFLIFCYTLLSNSAYQQLQYLKNAKTESVRNASNVQHLNKSYIHAYNYQLLLSPSKVCQDKDNVSILIIICSAPTNKDRRNSIRNSWSSVASSLGATVYFLLGGSSDIVNKRIEEESRIFGDIIQYNFKDSYRNLTIKSVHLLKWSKDNCIRSNYVMKVDDDVFVNLYNLQNYVNNINETSNIYMFGLISKKGRPYRNHKSKYFISFQEYPFPFYPPYLIGGAYFLSRRIISTLYETSVKIPFFLFEDIFITAFCRLELNLTLQNVEDFKFLYSQKYSLVRNIVRHPMSAQGMYDLWKRWVLYQKSH